MIEAMLHTAAAVTLLFLGLFLITVAVTAFRDMYRPVSVMTDPSHAAGAFVVALVLAACSFGGVVWLLL
jgi:hypothetical protein